MSKSSQSDSPLGTINASNPALINILLQQAAKTKEKKRPTFEEVFTKLNARTAKMNANKNPMNNMLTNEQLFRYYIKDTEPKLRVSDESFNVEAVEAALNPMKESDPTKVYGSATTQTSDIIPSRNPYNNAMNVGYQDPLQVAAEAAARAAAPRPNKPISGKLAAAAAAARNAGVPFATIAATVPEAPQAPTYFPEPPAPITSATVDVVLAEADNNYRDALAINNRLELADYSTLQMEGEMLLKILFSNDYEDQGLYYLKQLIEVGGAGIEYAISGLYDIFYQVRLNKPTNAFIVNKIAGIIGADFSYGIGVKEEFDKLYNPNNVSQQEFIQNIAKKVNARGLFNPTERARLDRELAFIDSNTLKDTVGNYLTQAERTYYSVYGKAAVVIAATADPTDPFELFNKAAENDRNAEMVFEGLMDELFNDMATEMTTNTDINSTVLDPELVAKISERNRAASVLQASAATTASVPSVISSTIAEAGSPAGIDIENVNMRRGRGVQAGDIRGPYGKTRKKTAASTLQAAARRALEQQSGNKGSV